MNSDFDACIPNPCLNGGTCIPPIGDGDCSCKCRKNCFGDKCENCSSKLCEW